MGLPLFEYGQLVCRPFTCFCFQFFDSCRDIGFVDFLQLGKGAFLAAVFFLQFGELGLGGFQFGFLFMDGLLFGGKVVIDDAGFGQQVAGPAFVFFLALFVFDQDAAGLGFPAVCGYQIAIVLHGLEPVVHQMLIDRILVDQRLAGVVA